MAGGGGEKPAAGLMLLGVAAAMVWANVAGHSAYEQFWSTPITVSGYGVDAVFDLRSLVNDVLMTLFFFVVGLEVKREFTLGELERGDRAVVPVVAAVAGMAVPAGIFLAFTAGTADARAWGIVISSDTAFVLGALALIGPRLPGHLRVFLLALAVVDDIGALGVIAVFYTTSLRVIPLIVAVLALLGVAAVPHLRSGRGPAYAVLALTTWIALAFSGVQPTLAGVVVALVLPAYAPRRADVERTAEFTRAFRQSPNAAYARAASQSLRSALSVNERLFTACAPYVNFIILPMFAVANAGVALDGATLLAAVRSPLTWAIVVGLVVGKFVGIAGSTAALRAARLGSLAPGLTLARISGGAALSGIGFTIALFIVDLAVPDRNQQAVARIGVLAASLIAFAAGAVIFRITDRVHPPSEDALYLIRPVDSTRDHLRGTPTAPLSVVEYGDFECPFTLRATGAVDEVIESLGNDVVYVYRHFPISRHHTWAMPSACASEAAALQGRFLEYGRLLFDNQSRLDDEHLMEYAAIVGLDVLRFDEDRRSASVIARVQDDITDADAMDIQETPTFFVNGRRHVGPWDAGTLVRELRTASPRL